VGYFEPKPGDALNKPRQGSLVRKLGAEGGCALACGDRAVVELRAQRSVRLAGENDLVGL
jgi:hypothetical protein